MRYSAFRLLREGLTGNKKWVPAWRDPNPKSEYDVVIVGGGGHGLATAYYLVKTFGIKRSLCWKRAGLVRVISGGIPRLSARTT